MKIYYFFLMLLICVAASCSPSVQTEAADDVNFEKFETYAYLPSGDTVSSLVVFEEKVIREVNQEMQARGYRLDVENPDLLVLVVNSYGDVNRWDGTPIPITYNYYGPGFLPPSTLSPYYYPQYREIPNVSGRAIREVPYTEGTFVVDVIKTDTREIIWRGWYDEPIDDIVEDSSIRAYVDKVFEEFPVEAK